MDDEYTGWCRVCVGEHATAEYLAKDEDTIVARKSEWKARTASSSPHAARERQRRHRLREALRPREAAGEWADPLELGKEALDALQRVRQALGAQVTARAYLDDACEKVKELAWGPVGVEQATPINVKTTRRQRIVIVRPRSFTKTEGQESLWEEAG